MRNFRFKFSFALFFVIVGSLHAVCQQSKPFSEVVFYGKPDFIVGKLSQARFKIKEDEKVLFKLKVNTTKSIIAEPGLKIFSCRILRKNSFTLDVKPNHRYLVEVKAGGIFFDKPKFRLVSEREMI